MIDASQRLMDIPETARYLGRSKSAVRAMVHRGILPVTRIDGRVQIDRKELDRLIEAKTITKKRESRLK